MNVMWCISPQTQAFPFPTVGIYVTGGLRANGATKCAIKAYEHGVGSLENPTNMHFSKVALATAAHDEDMASLSHKYQDGQHIWIAKNSAQMVANTMGLVKKAKAQAVVFIVVGEDASTFYSSFATTLKDRCDERGVRVVAINTCHGGTQELEKILVVGSPKHTNNRIRLEKEAANLDCILALTQDNIDLYFDGKTRHLDEARKKICYAPNGDDPPAQCAKNLGDLPANCDGKSDQQVCLNPDVFTVFVAGRGEHGFLDVKGHLVTLKAALHLIKHEEWEIQLLVFGSGNWVEAAKELTKDHEELKRRVHFGGFVPDASTYCWLATVATHLTNNPDETSSKTAREIRFCWKPTVYSRNGDTKEVFGQGGVEVLLKCGEVNLEDDVAAIDTLYQDFLTGDAEGKFNARKKILANLAEATPSTEDVDRLQRSIAATLLGGTPMLAPIAGNRCLSLFFHCFLWFWISHVSASLSALCLISVSQ